MTSSLMGIIFGCAIVYIITRLVAVQRRVCHLERHVVKKADEELLDTLSTKIQDTQTLVSGLAQGINNAINTPPPPAAAQPDATPVMEEEAGVCLVSLAEEMDVPISDKPTLIPDLDPHIPPPSQGEERSQPLPEPDIVEVKMEERSQPLPEPDTVEVKMEERSQPLPEPDTVEGETCPVAVEEEQPAAKPKRGRRRK